MVWYGYWIRSVCLPCRVMLTWMRLTWAIYIHHTSDLGVKVMTYIQQNILTDTSFFRHYFSTLYPIWGEYRIHYSTQYPIWGEYQIHYSTLYPITGEYQIQSVYVSVCKSVCVSSDSCLIIRSLLLAVRSSSNLVER